MHLARTAAEAADYYFNSEIELAESAPLSPLFADTAAIKGYEKTYQNLNKKNFAYIPFNGFSSDENRQVTPPFRADNTPQIGVLIEGRNKAELDIAQCIGIPDVNFGEDVADKSGRSVFLRQTEGEIATIHYSSNLQKSVKQTCRVLLDLASEVMVDPEQVVITNEDGESVEVAINYSDLGIDSSKYEIGLTHGIMNETKKREHQAQLIEIAQLAGNPQTAPFLIPLVESTDNPYSEKVVKALKIAYPQLDDDNKEDPKALAVLQEMETNMAMKDEQIDQLESTIHELNAIIVAQNQSNETDLIREKMKSDTTLEKADKDNATRITIEQIKQGNENSRKVVDVAVEQERQINDDVKEALKDEREANKEIQNKLIDAELDSSRRDL